MKAVKDRREEFYDPERKNNILGRHKTRLELWEEHLKDLIVALDKALKCVESSCWACFLARDPVVGVVSNGFAQASSNVCGRGRSGRAFGPTWTRGIVCVYAQRPLSGCCAREVWAAWRALFPPDSEGASDDAG